MVLGIGVYHYSLSKRLVIVEQKADAHQVNFDEFLYSGNADQLSSEDYKSDFIEAAASSREAVVYILAYEKFDKGAFQNGYKREKGSGVIIHKDGYVVTNYHVVEKATHIEITLNNRKEYLAEVVGIDPTTDLALLKIEASGLPYLVFGNSDELNVGQWVLAVGNPFGLQSTVTAGIISAKARNIELAEMSNNIESLIQSDVAINPGSSGGALEQSADSADLVHHSAFRLNEVYFQYALTDDLVADTIDVDGYHFIGTKAYPLNVDVLAQNTFLKSGSTYRQSDIEQTYRRLSRLNAIDHVGIRFRESDKMLDVIITLTPSRRQSFAIETQGSTNSAGFLGVEGDLVYRHRNIFRGAETLELRLQGGAQSQALITDNDSNADDFGHE